MDDADSFCVKCGTSIVTAEVESNVYVPPPPPPPPTPEELERAAQEEREAKAAAKAERKAARIEKRQERRARRKAAIRRRWYVFYPALLVVIAGIGYGVAQQAIIASTGPEETLDAYVAALKTGDFKVLNDKSLFPGSTQIAPERIQAGFKKSSISEVSYIDVVRVGDNASAEIVSSPSQTAGYEIELTADYEKYGIFKRPVWRITTYAPTVSVDVASILAGSQTVRFGSDTNAEPYTIDELRSIGRIAVLPGDYTFELSDFGMINGTSTTSRLWSVSSNTLSVGGSTDAAMGAARSSATKSANAIASRCVKKRCAALPRPGEYDFALWSQYPYTTYTTSKFSRSYSLDSCSFDTENVVSATVATFDYTCSVSITGHLYVKWIYYYGYFSDYYYYYNLYDSMTRSVYVEVTVETSADGKKTRQKSIRIY